MSEVEFHSGVRNGVLREWNKRGQLILSASVRDGEFDGDYKSWWDSGGVKEVGVYTKGERQPGYRWYRADGSLWSES